MKNRVLSFLKKYWLYILLSVIMVVGLYLSSHYAYLYETGSEGDMIRFDLGDLYLIYGLPLCSLIYGCLSFIKVKKIWLPQLILFTTIFLHWFIYGIDALFWGGTYPWSAVPVLFSLIGTRITVLIYKVIKSIKERKNQKP
jgi:hypothetical protein